MGKELDTLEKLSSELTARMEEILGGSAELRSEIDDSGVAPRLMLWVTPLEIETQDTIVRVVADIEKDVYGLADAEDSVFDVMCNAPQNLIEIWLNDPAIQTPNNADFDNDDW